MQQQHTSSDNIAAAKPQIRNFHTAVEPMNMRRHTKTYHGTVKPKAPNISRRICQPMPVFS